MSRTIVPVALFVVFATACDDEASTGGGDADVASDAVDTARDRTLDFNADAVGDADAEPGDAAEDPNGPDAPDAPVEDLLDADVADEPELVVEDVTDTGTADTAQEVEDTPDADEPDAAAAGLCEAFAEDLVGELGNTLVAAVDDCVAGSCADCAAASGEGASCGEGLTLTGCVLDCFEDNDFGACGEGDSCADGLSCNTAEEPAICQSVAIALVRGALDESNLDVACLGCYAAVPNCLYANGCGETCGTGGCPCSDCLCDNFCSQDFATCSGLADDLYEDGCELTPDDDTTCRFGSSGFCAEISSGCP